MSKRSETINYLQRDPTDHPKLVYSIHLWDSENNQIACTVVGKLLTASRHPSLIECQDCEDAHKADPGRFLKQGRGIFTVNQLPDTLSEIGKVSDMANSRFVWREGFGAVPLTDDASQHDHECYMDGSLAWECVSSCRVLQEREELLHNGGKISEGKKKKAPVYLADELPENRRKNPAPPLERT